MTRKQAENICRTISEFIQEGKANSKMLAMFFALNDMISSGEIK
jgi:hypothetical protein